MKQSRRYSFLFFLIFLTMTWGVSLLSQVSEEYLYKKRDGRFEGVKPGTPIAGERLVLLSALIKFQRDVPSAPEKLNVGFFLHEDASNEVTVRKYDKRYYMNPINTDYKSGFNAFSWDATIINALNIDLRALHATVKFRGQNMIAPAILYDAPLPSPLKVEAYQFVFVPSVTGDVEYKILHNGEVKTQGPPLTEQPPDQQTSPITWECQDASEGWYKLLMTFRFKLPFRPLQESTFGYEFYHKPEIEIPKLEHP